MSRDSRTSRMPCLIWHTLLAFLVLLFFAPSLQARSTLGLLGCSAGAMITCAMEYLFK